MATRNILSVPIHRRTAGTTVQEQDLVAVEEPLQMRIDDRNIAIAMRTPGQDAELTAGFLFTEGIVQPGDIKKITVARNTADVTLHNPTNLDATTVERNFYVTSSCGVCGKASIGSLESAGCSTLPKNIPQVSEAVIRSLPTLLRKSQQVFDRTGGLHACGLFTVTGELSLVREDVGRHNAVDKLVGRAYLDNVLPLSNNILMLSGRTSFELVQKATMAGIPIVAAVGAPSSLAVKTALRFGVTLIGFLRDDRFNIYSGASRIV